MAMAKLMTKTGYNINDTSCIERYLKSIGWVKHKQPRKFDNSRYTGKEFCLNIQCSLNPNKKYIAKIGQHHIVAIVNGKINDIWDCSDNCIGNYWTKE